MGLCIGGLLLSGYGLYEVASGRIYQAWRGPELDRTLDSLPPQPAPHRAIGYQQGSAIGRLEVQRIGLSVVVLEGSDAGTLRLGVGRVRNSSLPGEAGNVVLAGHRDTFFSSLSQIRPGDRISLRTPEGTFPYTVDWTTVVNPQDTKVIRPTAQPALTLVTCYPFAYVGAAPKRFIVRATPVDTTSTATLGEGTVRTAVPERRPSPFGGPAKVVRQAAVKPAVPARPSPAEQSPAQSPGQSGAMTTTQAQPVAMTTPAQPVAMTATLAQPVAFAKPTPSDTASIGVDNPPTAPSPSTEPRKGPLKRAFHRIAGVFSSHRDKMQ